MPAELQHIPRDRPLIYFAMGSSGTPEIVARILESFEGRPYRVIAPVKFQIAQLPGVHIPSNVLVTDWLPALQVNKMADLAVIHGGIGTVMTAALAGQAGGRRRHADGAGCKSGLSRTTGVRDPDSEIARSVPRRAGRDSEVTV